MPTTTVVNHQFQPVMKPATGPMNAREYAANDPETGCSTAISPSMRMRKYTITPTSANEISTAGPAYWIDPAEPKNRPVPIDEPKAIIINCLLLTLLCRPCSCRLSFWLTV